VHADPDLSISFDGSTSGARAVFRERVVVDVASTTTIEP